MLKNFSEGIIQRRPPQSMKKTCEIIAVTSGKGGVGKSTVSVNMAINLQQMNKKVLLVDADLHLGNIDLILGTRSKRTIADVVGGKASLAEVIMTSPHNIDVLPASTSSINLIEKEDYVLRKLADAFRSFDHQYDYIIVDTGAGIGINVISFLLGADKIVLVLTPDPASITDAYAVVKVMCSVNKSASIFLVANKVSSASEGEVIFKKLNLMVQKFLDSRLFFGGAMMRDDLIARSVKRQTPFVTTHPNSAAATSIRVVNRRILQAPHEDHGANKNIFDRLLNSKKIQYEWNL